MAEPEPDCSALLDEELSSFVFNYLSDSQVGLRSAGLVSGDTHPTPGRHIRSSRWDSNGPWSRQEGRAWSDGVLSLWGSEYSRSPRAPVHLGYRDFGTHESFGTPALRSVKSGRVLKCRAP